MDAMGRQPHESSQCGCCVAGFYHAERNHQGLDNELIEPGEEVGAVAGKIECRERLGGLLRYYYRDAA